MTQNWNVQDNIEMGITFLYEGSIQDAYAFFTMALNLEPHNVSALSFRAKTALKLNDKCRNTALEDIEAALRVDPCRGELYLIENQILLTKPGQYQEALKRLQKAQFKVFHDDPYIHQISEQLQKQKATQMNYIMDLPTEILYHIMSLLSFRSRIPCLAVSHRWRDRLKHISDLWRDLDYSEAVVGRNNYSHATYYGMAYNRYTRAIHDRHLESCIVSSVGCFMEWTDIRKLKIPLSNEMVEKLLERRPALYEVSFMYTESLIDSLVLQLLIREIGSTWRKIEIDSNLEPLNFFNTASLYCPLLNDLTIQRCQSQRSIPHSVTQLLHPIPSVTTLHLSHCVFTPMFLMLSQLFPELHELTIEGSGFVNSLNFHTTLRNLSKLKRLILRDSFTTNGINLISFLRDEKDKEQEQQLEWLDINDFSIKREGMLTLLDTMQSGTLKRFNEEFVMDKQVDRKRLKEVIDQKQPAAPQMTTRRLHHRTLTRILQRREALQQDPTLERHEVYNQPQPMLQFQLAQQQRLLQMRRQEQQQSNQVQQQEQQQRLNQVQQQEQRRQVIFYDLTLDEDDQHEEDEEYNEVYQEFGDDYDDTVGFAIEQLIDQYDEYQNFRW